MRGGWNNRLLAQVHILRYESFPVCDGDGQRYILSRQTVELGIDHIRSIAKYFAAGYACQLSFVGNRQLVIRRGEVSVGIIDSLDVEFDTRSGFSCGFFIDVEEVVVLVLIGCRNASFVTVCILCRGEGRAYGGIFALRLIDQI